MNYSIFVHFYTVNWNVQPDQHLHALTLCIGMPILINMVLSSFCFCAANWNVNYSTFVHFYTVNWNVQPDQHLYASTLHIGMWTTQCFWYFYAVNWSVKLIKHFLSFLLIRALVCEGETMENSAVFIWSHILRNVHKLLLWTDCEFIFLDLMKHFLFKLLLALVWTCHKGWGQSHSMASCLLLTWFNTFWILTGF